MATTGVDVTERGPWHAATLPDTCGGVARCAAASELRPGTMIGRYRLVSMLGSGGMGVVWSAIDPQLERAVAIKLVHPALVRARDVSVRLLREARAMAKLSHRAVVTVHDAGQVDGQLFVAMELVNGTSLGALLRARAHAGGADWPRWLAMILDAGRGLAAAHEAGILHRDFKPDNVLVDAGGRVCVSDFGLATLADMAAACDDEPASAAVAGDSVDAGPLTMTGALLGTPAYMSPQQLRGEPVDAAADQFSFCVAAYEALYGYRPFATDTTGFAAIAELAQAIDERQVRPEPAGSSVPAALRRVILRGLEPDPAERWPSMTALLAAIDTELAASRPAAAPPPRRDLVRLRTLAIAGVLAAVVLATIVAARGANASQGRSQPPAPERMFGVPFGTRLAVSDDGRHLALAADRIEIRDLAGTRYGSYAILGASEQVGHMELTDDELRVGMYHTSTIDRWTYAGGSGNRTEREIDGRWLGTLADGDLIRRGNRGPLLLVRDGRVVASWPVPDAIDVSAPSPDKRRFAYLDTGRFFGTIVVIDREWQTVMRSPRLVEPVGLCWIDDHTLAYSTGTNDQPTIWRTTVTADGFTPPSVLHSASTGWFSRLAANRDTLFFVDAQPSTRVRLVDRSDDAPAIQDLEPSQIGGGLGWTDDDKLLSWNRTTRQIERLVSSHTGDALGVQLDGEPANATLANDMLIVALRRPGGRELVGISLQARRIAWRLPDRAVLVARCAGDARPPCFALRRNAKLDVEVVPFDPGTGTLGSAPLTSGRLDDVAVADGGDRLVVVGASAEMQALVHEIDRSGTLLRELRVPLDTARSVAYDPAGGILVAGTLTRTTYEVGRWVDGKYTKLLRSDSEIVSLVRPAHGKAAISILARTFSPELMRLRLTSSR